MQDLHYSTSWVILIKNTLLVNVITAVRHPAQTKLHETQFSLLVALRIKGETNLGKNWTLSFSEYPDTAYKSMGMQLIKEWKAEI